MTSSVTPTVVAPYFVSAGTSDVKRSCAQQTHMSPHLPSYWRRSEKVHENGHCGMTSEVHIHQPVTGRTIRARTLSSTD